MNLMQLKLINRPPTPAKLLLIDSGDHFAVLEGAPYSVAQVQGVCIQADGILSINFACYLGNGYNLFHEGKLYLQQQRVSLKTTEYFLFTIKQGKVDIIERFFYNTDYQLWQHPIAQKIQAIQRPAINTYDHDDWAEVHFDVVSELNERGETQLGKYTSTIADQGHGGLYELSKQLTDKFMAKHAATEWAGDYQDCLEAFFEEELGR